MASGALTARGHQLFVRLTRFLGLLRARSPGAMADNNAMQADLRSRLYGSASRPTLATGASSASGATTVAGGRALQHRPMPGVAAAGSRRKKGGRREPKQASQRAAAATLLRGKRSEDVAPRGTAASEVVLSTRV